VFISILLILRRSIPQLLSCVFRKEHFKLPYSVSPLCILVAQLSNKDHEKQSNARDEAEREREGKELRDEQTEKDPCKNAEKVVTLLTYCCH
jgi:hypothetical protein